MNATLAPVYERHGVTVYHGDCLDVLRDLDDASVDAVVCDPPYGLAEHRLRDVAGALAAWLDGDRERVPDGKGFMGRDWDRYVPPPAVWDECLRVLKPGGHLLAFAGSRTADLMGLAIRLAAFEVRDTIMWIYGSGFPKSLDVSKAIDKMAGAEREVVGTIRNNQPGGTSAFAQGGIGEYKRGDTREREIRGGPATPAAAQWEGWNTALKPAHEPIIVARKPLAGTVAQTVLTHGTGALNIDATRVGMSDADAASINAKHAGMDVGAYQRTPGSSLNLSVNPLPLRAAEAHAAGRWPTNVVLSHSTACGTEDEPGPCVDGCPVADLDQQSGVTDRPSKGVRGRGGSTYANGAGFANTLSEVGQEVGYGDSGGASRFFPAFRWEAKAPTAERPQVNGRSHPTVKPLALMRWLVRLVTPPGGLVLDPFAGSGTTLHAARAEGFRAVGVEREAEYVEMIRARLDARPRQAEVVGEDAANGDEPLDLLDLLGEATP